MRFYGTLLAISMMLFLGVGFLIFFVSTNFPLQYFWVEVIFLIVGLFLFMISIHELCHLVALLVTHNQDRVGGLGVSYRVIAIKYEGQVPSKDATMVYLSPLLTAPLAFLAFYWFPQKYLLRFVPIELVLPLSLVMGVGSLLITLLMSKWDISDWKHIRNKNRR